MIYIATTISGKNVNLGTAYSAEINKSKEAPADSLTVLFPSTKAHPEYKYIDVYFSENQMFFSGIVDKQSFKITTNGSFLSISARSKAAYLIDNQATAQTYQRPYLNIIFQRHAQPYGFTAIYGDNSVFNYSIDVQFGMSEWDVLEEFCTSCLNVFPIINTDGTIDATGNSSLKKLFFSNIPSTSSNYINYSSICQNFNRYKLISEITVCTPYEALYVANIKDQNAIDKDIKRRKFIVMTEDDDFYKNISVNTAQKMIANAEKKSFELSISCPGAVYAQIDNTCEINDYILGKIENLKVYEVEYNLNQNGETTVITLLEE